MNTGTFCKTEEANLALAPSVVCMTLSEGGRKGDHGPCLLGPCDLPGSHPSQIMSDTLPHLAAQNSACFKVFLVNRVKHGSSRTQKCDGENCLLITHNEKEDQFERNIFLILHPDWWAVFLEQNLQVPNGPGWSDPVTHDESGSSPPANRMTHSGAVFHCHA